MRMNITRESLGLPEPLAYLAEPPVFIVGCVRSGTTWVADIFDAHPAVAVVYESFVLTRDAGLAIFTERKHWEGEVGVGRLMDRPEFIREIRDTTARWLGKALKPGDRYLVEKTPSHLYAINFIADVFPEARFVYVVRDGRDVALSIHAASRTWAPQWKRTVGKSIASAARAWSDAAVKARAAAARLDRRWFELRYESLLSEPLACCSALFDFCRIDYDDAMLRRVVKATDFQEVHGDKKAAFYRRGEAGEWRQRLNMWDSLVFEWAAGQTLRDTGYEDSSEWWLRQPLRTRSW
jgi:hypothetical protein